MSAKRRDPRAGIMFGIASGSQGRSAIAEFIVAFAAAVSLHPVWDASTSVAVHIVITAIGFVILIGLVRRAAKEPVTGPNAAGRPGQAQA
ncbi:MAG: hypothetical protein ACK5MP_10735 [Nostocoides sp.]